jgi:hypothetical protein
MNRKSGMRKALGCMAAAAVTAAIAAVPAQAQGRRGAPAGPPPTAEASAPIDLTGYWVSMTVDEWRFEVDPQKGDILYIPLNAEGRKIAMAWDPVKDKAEGQQCKAYGAVGVMQRPGRLHITWQDPNTLRLDTDAGTQTRTFHFESPEMAMHPAALHPAHAVPPSWQGSSVAEWEVLQGRRNDFINGPPPKPMERQLPGKSGSLKVVTTDMRPGYLRLNGAPYSDKATLTEYFDTITGDDGQVYLVVLTEVADPTYLNGLFVRSYQFKKLPDSQGWDPTPCWNK